ncbi:hypothetical protein JX266_005601 [Neoarthrinium moseri]|nr:hypothetical protein JX266_005601 [Neoarthrinium moseri]
MGLLTIVEERPTPPSVYNWRIYVLAAIASCGSCMIGYTSAFIGTTVGLDSFKSEFGLDKMSKSETNLISENIVSLFVAGAFFGALFTYCLSHFIGRKHCLAIGAATFSLGAGLNCGADSSRGLGILYAGRVLTGLGTGVASNIIPIYISELSPPAIRGRLVGLYELGWQIGGLVGFWINYGIEQHMAPSRTQWIIPFAVQLIPSGLLLIGSLWIRDSPRWLFLKNHRDQAIKNLCWIRQLEPTDMYITEEIAAIDKIYEMQKSTVGFGFWQPFKALGARPNLQWRLFLGCMLFFWQNGSGINAINYYSPTIFSSIGIESNTVNMMTGIFGVVKAIMTFVWLLFLVDQLGRRKLLLIGAVTGSVCMWVIGAYVCVVEPTKNPQDHLTGSGIAAIVFFYLWTAVYTPTWNGTPWVINSEFFDPNFRSLAGGATTASNWLFNFLVSRFTEQMFAAMGYGVYFFFASLSFLAFFFAFFLIPETSGVPLEKVDRLFEIKPVWRANATLMAQLREEEAQFRLDTKYHSRHQEQGGQSKAEEVDHEGVVRRVTQATAGVSVLSSANGVKLSHGVWTTGGYKSVPGQAVAPGALAEDRVEELVLVLEETVRVLKDVVPALEVEPDREGVLTLLRLERELAEEALERVLGDAVLGVKLDLLLGLTVGSVLSLLVPDLVLFAINIYLLKVNPDRSAVDGPVELVTVSILLTEVVGALEDTGSMTLCVELPDRIVTLVVSLDVTLIVDVVRTERELAPLEPPEAEPDDALDAPEAERDEILDAAEAPTDETLDAADADRDDAPSLLLDAADCAEATAATMLSKRTSNCILNYGLDQRMLIQR